MTFLRLAPARSLAMAVTIFVFVLAGCGDPGENSISGGSFAEGANTALAPASNSSGTTSAGAQTARPATTPGASIATEPTGAEPAAAPVATATPQPSPTPVVRPAAPNGRVAPAVAVDPSELVDQIVRAEAGLGAPGATAAELADWGHLHQVAIRKLGYEPEWDITVFSELPPELTPRTLLHVSARRALIDLSSGYAAANFIPAWQIVEPAPTAQLLDHYHQAEAATGIEWEYLAAINLIETGMGRIRGLSSAGAKGPMQFLPSTWAEAGIGEGDIENPGDAIAGAARYLVRRGGPSDMAGAIWGYNNSDNYVAAVQAYAELLRQDPAAYQAIYNWEIYFFTEAGDVWLPTGFVSPEVLDLPEFLDANPWSAPDAGLR